LFEMTYFFARSMEHSSLVALLFCPSKSLEMAAAFVHFLGNAAFTLVYLMVLHIWKDIYYQILAATRAQRIAVKALTITLIMSVTVQLIAYFILAQTFGYYLEATIISGWFLILPVVGVLYFAIRLYLLLRYPYIPKAYRQHAQNVLLIAIGCSVCLVIQTSWGFTIVPLLGSMSILDTEDAPIEQTKLSLICWAVIPELFEGIAMALMIVLVELDNKIGVTTTHQESTPLLPKDQSINGTSNENLLKTVSL